MIDEETFTDMINFVEIIYRNREKMYDENHGNLYDFMFDVRMTIKNIIKLLGLFFPNKLCARTDIEFYCFCLNFGKISPESEYITPGQLYEDLLN